jgi:hypothetical protein
LGNALRESFSTENRTATVIVQPAAVGDTSLVTVVTFTNYKAPPAQLELCKIAGVGVASNTSFTFGVTFPTLSFPETVEAGPPSQGGYCVLIDRTVQVGRAVFVNEAVPAGYLTPAITVNGVPTTPSVSSCTPSSAPYDCLVEFAVGPGINDVSFTNCTSSPTASCIPPLLPGQDLDIVNYSLVSQVAVAGTHAQSYMTYRADLLNTGTPILSPVTAKLTSLDPSVQVVGKGALSFASASANSPVASSNTFTILTNPAVPLDFSKLSWTYQSTRSISPAP